MILESIDWIIRRPPLIFTHQIQKYIGYNEMY